MTRPCHKSDKKPPKYLQGRKGSILDEVPCPERRLVMPGTVQLFFHLSYMGKQHRAPTSALEILSYIYIIFQEAENIITPF